MASSINHATVALRWPGYEISGSGRVAVILECQRKVVLVSSPMEAAALMAERCGQYCGHMQDQWQGWHKTRVLDTYQQQAYVPSGLCDE
jgi:hypothetical protein